MPKRPLKSNMPIILLIALVVRLYGIHNPVLDWHAFRQADTASVTRWYVQHGIDLLTPRYDDISNVASGLENPEGYRMVEFPIVNAVIAVLAKATSIDTVLLSRMSSIAISLASVYLVYLLVKKISGEKTALAAALVMAILPFNVYYSRVILPEPYLVFGVLGGITAWWYYLSSKKTAYVLLAVLSLSFALLMKPFAIFVYPVLAAMAWLTWGWGTITRWEFWTLGVSLAPILGWRWWIMRYPEGIPSSDWLFNSTDIRFKPSWFKWLFFERIGRLMLGWTGVLGVAASLLQLNRAERWIYGSWWAGMVVYLLVIATGNIRHDYYQALLAPILAITLGKGFVALYATLRAGITRKQLWVLTAGVGTFVFYGLTFMLGWQGSGFYPERLASEWVISTLILGLLITYFWLNQKNKLPHTLALSLVASLAASAFVLSGRYVGEYYKIHHWDYLKVAEEVQTLIPQDAKVIAPADGDTMFLYQLNRPGWAMGTDIETKIANGATHYISVNYDNVVQDLSQRFTVVSQTDEYTLLDLTQPK